VNLRDFVKMLRTRWVTVCVTALAVIIGAILFTVLQTPLYQASTRLFVSTTAGATTTDLVQSSRYSVERVLSYAELLKGETLAQRTINRLNLDMSAGDLKEKVSAKSKLNTVLIDVSVRDASPVRARDIANALSDEFVVMARELETTTKEQGPGAQVIVEQRASVPKKPVVPNKKLNLGFGVLLGVLLGIGLGLVRDQLDNTIKGSDSVEEITGIGAVGFIPFDKNLQASPTLSFDNDNSGTAEAFRKLRTNLQFLAVDRPPRLIVVSSASPNEGKSTTAINIALALAEANHRVVLVDGDLRRPSLANRLKLVGTVGLSTVLSGSAQLSEVLQETQFPGLAVLTAGTSPPNPSELLGSGAAKNLLNELRSQFDYVIIDSSPLLAVTDAAILAAEADGVLVAVRAGKTKREQLEHTIGNLKDVGANLLGAVLTMMPTRGGGAYNYTYSYSYGGQSKSRKGSNREAESTDTAI